jgi:ERCC4-type nuclease
VLFLFCQNQHIDCQLRLHPQKTKTIPDLVNCCTGDNRARFERELHRLRGYRFKRLLVIGTEQDIREERYFFGVNPASVLSSLYAFEVRYDLPVVFAPSTSVAACQIERWAFYFARQMVEDVNDLWRGTTPQPTNDSSLESPARRLRSILGR